MTEPKYSLPPIPGRRADEIVICALCGWHEPETGDPYPPDYCAGALDEWAAHEFEAVPRCEACGGPADEDYAPFCEACLEEWKATRTRAEDLRDECADLLYDQMVDDRLTGNLEVA